jgi:hypothetical protein
LGKELTNCDNRVFAIDQLQVVDVKLDVAAVVVFLVKNDKP